MSIVRRGSKKMDDAADALHRLKLIEGPTNLKLRSLFNSKRVNIIFRDYDMCFTFAGANENKFKLLYSEVARWSVYKGSSHSEVHFIYQRVNDQHPKKIILRTKDNNVLKLMLDDLDNHIAELMVHKGMAQDTKKALNMFERFAFDSNKKAVPVTSAA